MATRGRSRGHTSTRSRGGFGRAVLAPGFYPNQLSPLAWYDAALVSPGTLTDQQGGTSATLVGSPTWAGGFITFDGVTQYATIPATAMPAMGTSSSWTVVIVVKKTTSGSSPSERLWQSGDPPGALVYTLDATLNYYALQYDSTPTYAQAGPGTVTQNQWAVITSVCTGRSATGLGFQVNNGSLATVSNATLGASTSSTDTYIAAAPPGSANNVAMQFRSFLSFDRALNAVEIANLVDYFRGGQA